MSLYDNYDPNRKGGGDYLSEGTHRVRVTGNTMVTSDNKGTKGVEVELTDGSDRTINSTFWTTNADGKPSGALWRLANFAAACGLNEQELRTYDDQNENAHRVLMNRQLVIAVKKIDKDNGKHWHEVDSFEPANNADPLGIAPDAIGPPPAHNDGPPATDEDGIPF